MTKAISAVREHLAASNRALPYLSAELVKRLPVAAGLGGGSSDAVAALKLVARFAASQGHPISQDAMLDMALKLGADCPLFLMNGPVRMEGIGEQLSKLDGWSGLEVVLVNPNVPVSTPEIFRELQNKTQPAVADLPASWATTEDRLQWLAAHTRNDLQTPAIAMEPVITDVLAILDGAENCVLARMSGSGATCFGLFADHGAAAKAAVAIQAQRPQWWVAQSHTIGN
ncbi:MAG: 4-(cytidine 5'-diphospho)-2-C-methyl-D-erythritol kinase [Pseudomonadota bacterium]